MIIKITFNSKVLIEKFNNRTYAGNKELLNYAGWLDK